MNIQPQIFAHFEANNKRRKKESLLNRYKTIAESFFYSFPVQLLLFHVKNNQVLLLCWLLLFAIVTENFGKVFGVPYLFLDPEYIKEVGFWSFFIMGIALGGFIMAFHITCYIMDGHKFRFLGLMSRPFTKFSVNNAVIPTLFLIVYVFSIIRFEINNEHYSISSILIKISGLFSGCLAMFSLLYSYFRFTNKDVFRFVAAKVDRRLKKAALTRKNVLARYKDARKGELRIDNYFDVSLSVRPTADLPHYINKDAILKVFDQNHLNSVIIESLALAGLLLLGLFRDTPVFQIPAAASFLLFFTIFIMFAGAISFWFKKWAITAVIGLVLLVNLLVENEVITKTYQAYGLNYNTTLASYSLPNLKSINSKGHYLNDKKNTLEILENWKRKFPTGTKPKMIFICSSGGGQRAALWTFSALQAADSVTNSQLLKNTMLMTGASGGLIGASYFRELYLQKQLGEPVELNASSYRENISRDILNPVIFSLVVNDLYVRYQTFNYGGMTYPKDRGYAFEEALNRNTKGILDKKLSDCALPEQKSLIPMVIMAPTIINDGRKLYISPHHVSYMNLSHKADLNYADKKIKGMDFRYLFHEQRADELRFLTALRMSATFPYITPNVHLPTSPAIEIMDAGLSDNFGVTDALGFLSVFKDWIHENTSGVIIFSIRDSEKNTAIEQKPAPSLFEKVITPVRSLYNNWANIQDIHNDNQINLARLWYQGELHRIDLEYVTSTSSETKALSEESAKQEKKQKEIERASLSWHLTTLEKQNIISNISLARNQKALHQLKQLLEEE